MDGIELYFERDLTLCIPVPYQSKTLVPPCDNYNYKIEIKSGNIVKYNITGDISRAASKIPNNNNPDRSKEENKITFIRNYPELYGQPYRSMPDNITVSENDIMKVTVTCNDNCAILMPNLRNVYDNCYNCDNLNPKLLSVQPIFLITTQIPTTTTKIPTTTTQIPLTTGLILYFPFRDINKINQGILNISCSFMNSPSIITNKLRLISAKGQYVLLQPFPTTTTTLTFSCWISSNVSRTSARIFDFGNGPASDNIIMYINNNCLGLSVYSGNRPYQVSDACCLSNMNNNTMNHIVWTINNLSWILYINGNKYNTFTSNILPKLINRNNNYIGKSNWRVDPNFNGYIYDFRMYNRILSSSDINNLYTSTKII